MRGKALEAHRLVNQQITMIENFELSEASKSQRLGADLRHDGQKILNTRCEFDISKFIRLSIESFPDSEGSQLKAFKKFCFTAHKLEECFLIINAANQWVRTVCNLQSETVTNTSILDSIIESNILLYFPYWSQLGDEANTRLHFPSRMLQEAFLEGKPLKAKLQEWMDSGEDCKFGMHKRGPQSTSKTLFWKIQDEDVDAEVKFEDWIAEAQGISRVTWRGGTFACKQYPFDTEFEVVNRVSCHPNIVCAIGQLWEETEIPAYFTEYLSNDLCSVIVERKRLAPLSPPFSSYETLDILLQTAKAMKHIHQEGHVEVREHSPKRDCNIR